VEATLQRKPRGRTALPTLAVVVLLGLLAAALAPGAQAKVQSFQGLTSSSAPLTAVTTDPATGFVYAQENEGTRFFRYDPRTNAWTELAPAPINSGNNGGAALLNGKIYIVYTEEEGELSVYDIASNSWGTIPNPLEAGSANITAANGKLYLAVELDFLSLDPATGNVTTLADPPKFAPADCTEGFEKWGGLAPNGAGKIFGHQGNSCTGFGVYDIASNSWQELPLLPEVNEEGAAAGSTIDPVTNTYLTYGGYPGNTLFRYDIEAGSWSTTTLPFEVEDGGMAYVASPGFEGVYMVQGEIGNQFARYVERNSADLVPSMSAKVARGGKVTYSIQIRNSGPERASGVVLSDQLPKGARLVSAVTPLGTCAATPVLTCNLGLMPSGATATLTVQAQSRLRAITNTVTVSSQAADTNLGNDSAVVVSKQCVIPKLKKRSLKGAKKALRKANCKPKVVRRFNGKVDEGKVIRGGKPRGKVFPAGRKVKLIVSAGPKSNG
jgi:uncharacterized repeat protein (TIGR01451 family)